MLTLFHLPLSPHSRFVRLTAAEKAIAIELVALPKWNGAAPDHRANLDFSILSPDGDAPTLAIDNRILHGATAIVEFFEETESRRRLSPPDKLERAEMRRLIEWFNHRFYEDATRPLLEEKLVKKLKGGGKPNSDRIRAGAAAVRRHLALMEKLCQRRNWVAGEALSLADFAAAAQLSALDYIDSVAWDDFPPVKEWYTLVKCRPAFRGLLQDRLPGMPPAPHYTDLDF
jgi:glutathione S-transferase